MTLRVLVVEDEFLIAEEIAALISKAGYDVLGPAGSLAAAEAALTQMRPDFAVLDANLRGGSSAPLARRLEQLGVPFCVCTGYRLSDLQSTYGDAAVVRKPIDGPALLSIIRAALDA